MTWKCTKEIEHDEYRSEPCSNVNPDDATKCIRCGSVREIEPAPSAKPDGLSEEERAVLAFVNAGRAAAKYRGDSRGRMVKHGSERARHGAGPVPRSPRPARSRAEDAAGARAGVGRVARNPACRSPTDVEQTKQGGAQAIAGTPRRLGSAVSPGAEARAEVTGRPDRRGVNPGHWAENRRARNDDSRVPGAGRAKVEDCVLVEQMEGTKPTWHIEHSPKPAAPAGLPEVGESFEYLTYEKEWAEAKRCDPPEWASAGPWFYGQNRDGVRLAMPIDGVGTWWRSRIPPAQTGRGPRKCSHSQGHNMDDSGTRTCVACGEVLNVPAPPPGEVSTENLRKWHRHALQCGDFTWATLEPAIEADIRASVERATANDKARIAELEAKSKSDEQMYEGICKRLSGERDAALAEVERLKGELARLAQANKALHEEYADSVGLGPAASLDEVRVARKATKRCPADGMSDYGVGSVLIETFDKATENPGPRTSMGAKARELFTPSAPAQGGNEGGRG